MDRGFVMTEPKTIVDNVSKFLASAAEYYGRSCTESFSQEMWNNCLELEMQSPIEHLLWIAMHVVCKVNCVEMNAEPWLDGKQHREGLGLHLIPQAKLKPYRVDFIAYEVSSKPEVLWIIECDGHEFHERTREERQYEKKRDRFFTVRGYRVMRFTGSEIFKNSYAVSAEIIKAVCGDDGVVTPMEYWCD
jgi:very-short-patch-repair endonuclease